MSRDKSRGLAPWMDSVDPLWGMDSGGRGHRSKRKTLQLCEQVGRAVSDFLAVECDDPWLIDLIVETVVPDPDSRRLRAILVYVGDDPGFDACEAGRRLGALRGEVRREIAGAIHRKKVPEIVLDVLAIGEVRV